MTPELTLLPRVAYRGQEITSPRLRSLLALLAADLRVGASTSRLVDGLWRDERPENPIKALQILVSRVRSQLGMELIATTPTGYRLDLDENQVDATAILRRVADSARHARAGDHEATLAEAEAGLALWAGSLDGDDLNRDNPVTELRAERVAAHRSLVRVRALALARLGRHTEAIDALTELAAERPRDEELLLELLRSEAATAGPSAALTTYEAYRRELRDELGADPGAELQAFHRTLLLSSAPPVRRGVSHEPNPLLGRDEDIAAVERLLRTSRVTSIVGPGGLGKTRLAQAVLFRAEQRAGFFVPLAGLTADEDVLGEVAAVLGAGEPRTRGGTPAHGLVDGVMAAIGPGPALLVLDNCEHVLGGVAGLVQALIAKTSELRVLTTSRAPLGLTSESVYPLPELSLATMVELFTQRARAARPDVALPPDRVEEICRHLDGLPLAVELAAARVRVMSVAELARRLDDRFSLLGGGAARDLPQRHHTLRAVVSWSWNLLDAADQRAMRLLSVFPGGFTAYTAGKILEDDALDVLVRLVEQSLLRVTDTANGTRFGMLDTVREFSGSELTSAGEDGEAIAKLLAWARDVGREHCPGVASAERYSSVDVIRAEQENLGYALRLAVDRGDGRTVAATAAVLGFLSIVESNFVRMSSLVQEVSWLLSHYRPEPEDVEVTRTALALNVLYTFLLEGPKAVRSMVALRRLPQPSPETFAGAVSIIFAAVREDPSALVKLADSEYPYVAAGASAMASYYWEAENDIDRAIAAGERSLEAVEGQELPWLEAQAHARIGELCFQQERGADAVHHLSAALPVIERLGARTDALGLRWWIVLANLQRGDVDEAQRWVEPCTDIHVEPKLGTLGYDVGARAELSLACGDIDDGLQKWRQVIGLLDSARGETSAGVPILFDPWQVEARTVALTAHAQHGKVELVADLPVALEERLANLLTSRIVNPPPYLMEFQLGGSMLVALALADLDAAQRAEDESATRSAVRMVALAERFGYVRNFQPTMASGRIRAMAQSADRPAYEAAVSSYADLDREALRAEALAMLRLRPS